MSLPKWPEKPYPGSPDSWAQHQGAEYQKARADAAMARLKVAVEHIQSISRLEEWWGGSGSHVDLILSAQRTSRDLLAEIGELPE